MSTYSAINNSQIDAESYLDTVLMAQLRDNPLAIQEGDASAPDIAMAALASHPFVAADYTAGSVDQAAIGAAAVGQSEIKINTQTMSLTTSSANAISYVNASGGSYVLGYKHKFDSANGLLGITSMDRQDGQTVNLEEWKLNAGSSSGSITYTYNQSYIDASPPYNLGDGDIPLFVYVELRPDGSIRTMTSSPNPPWGHNGPTSIKASRRTRDGRSYRKIKDMSQIPRTLIEAESLGGAAVTEYYDAFRLADWIEEEITQEIKNRDMNLIPYGINNQIIKPMNTTVLLDPVSPILQEILELREHNQFDELEYIRKWCNIGNGRLKRKGPTGIKIVSLSKK